MLDYQGSRNIARTFQTVADNLIALHCDRIIRLLLLTMLPTEASKKAFVNLLQKNYFISTTALEY